MEHFLYCILYAFISILCRLSRVFVTLALLFFNCVMQFPHFGLPSGASYLLWIKTKKECCSFCSCQKKICLNKLVWLMIVALDYASLCACLGDAVQASLYFGMELESSVCLLFGHFCRGLAVVLINMGFQFHKLWLKLRVILVQIIQAVALMCSV